MLLWRMNPWTFLLHWNCDFWCRISSGKKIDAITNSSPQRNPLQLPKLNFKRLLKQHPAGLAMLRSHCVRQGPWRNPKLAFSSSVWLRTNCASESSGRWPITTKQQTGKHWVIATSGSLHILTILDSPLLAMLTEGHVQPRRASCRPAVGTDT